MFCTEHEYFQERELCNDRHGNVRYKTEFFVQIHLGPKALALTKNTYTLKKINQIKLTT